MSYPSGVGDLEILLRLLEGLALLNGKYDCAEALSSWRRRWFQQRLDSFSCLNRPWDRLRVAYALETDETFWGDLEEHNCQLLLRRRQSTRRAAALPGWWVL